MSSGPGPNDHLVLGDWNAVCYECGRKQKASTMKRHWQGYYLCPDHWEPRQPQDFVRGTKDTATSMDSANASRCFCSRCARYSYGST